ncbi:MAG: hypothetical protein ACYCYI_01665 [Saccharofermentanales bacterium]
MITVKIFNEDILQYTGTIEFMYETITFNMKQIMGDDFCEDNTSKQMWYDNNIIGTANKVGWLTVIAFDDDRPCAYFQFGVIPNEQVAVWDEMEIDAEHKGDHQTFWILIKVFLDEKDYTDCQFIRGYINNHNKKSQSIFQGLGFEITEETQRGKKYICSRAKIEEWYYKIK